MRRRWRRPSGWVTVPSFSAWDSAGKMTSACLVDSFSNIEIATTKSGVLQGFRPALAVGVVADGVDVGEDRSADSSSGLERLA